MARSGPWRVLSLAVLTAGATSASCRTGPLEPAPPISDGAARIAEVDPVSCESTGCPDGQHCALPPGCETVGVCRNGFVSPSCTAGIVASVCRCDGTVSATDGCPRRMAYVIGPYHGLTSMLAQRCDPAHRGPLSFGVQVDGDQLAAFEGRPVVWRFIPPPSNTRAQPAIPGSRTAVVAGGKISWQSAGPWEHGELPLTLLDLFFHVDLDGDGACDPEEPGSRYVRPTVDLITRQLRYQLPQPSLNGKYTCEP